MSKELSYREGSEEDLEQLRNLAISSYSQYSKDLDQDSWNELRKNLCAGSSYYDILKIAKCFVCEVGNELIGVAYLVPSGNPNEIFDAGWSYLRMVGVDPKYRGRGISRQLTLNCIEQARKSGEEILALHTSEFMDAARHIYESLGFKKIKELNPIFGKKYWLYHLVLDQQ